MGWTFSVDRGGTFTDIVGRDPDGGLHTAKVLSSSAHGDAAVLGITAMAGSDPIDAVRMGTTVATNALLERTGEPTVLAITAGFADALRIGDQHRPRLFERRIELPELTYARVIEIDERVAADGTVVRPLDLPSAETAFRAAVTDGFRAIAIVCVHGYRWPDHERALVAVATRAGFSQISASSEVSALQRLVPRGDTTVVDAYLSPGLARYTAAVADALGDVPLAFLQSNGGLAAPGRFRGKDAILSGPAGGIVGMARVAETAGFERVIGFDMGGTSTDVSLYSGRFERTYDSVVAGVRVRAPMLAIHTVAAGGGSILRFDGERYRVGPDSAGADPGPACYRRGGPATVTDANVVLGRIRPEHFPAVFGAKADQPLDGEAARAALAALGDGRAPEAVADGFRSVAVANMVNAIKRISVQRGHDVSRYTLVSFGGAGGQHACAVADALGMDTVLAHPLAGVLSAYGMGLAERRALGERAIERILDGAALRAMSGVLDELASAALGALVDEGVDPASVRIERRAHLRYDGTDTALEVGLGSVAAMVAEFEAAYRRAFSFLVEGRSLVVEAVSVEAVAEEPAVDRPAMARAAGTGSAQTVAMFVDGAERTAVLHRRDDLGAGAVIDGPAIVVEATATTVVDPGWRATVTERGDLVLRRSSPRPTRRAVGTEADPVMLEVFNGSFMAVAEQMGARLAATAQSVNIKERLDFSCALFGPDGALVANAPHMPVHLGSMGVSVRHVLATRAGTMRRGDAYALNDPYAGGTHLPDVTVITPVFGPGSNGGLWFVVASRGHHADIGGITPGSMPPASRTIDDEGIRFDDVTLVAEGRFCEAEVLALLTSGPHPARNPAQNLGDLRAQVAANAEGTREVLAMVDAFGLEVVQAYMGHVRANAEESVRRVIAALHDGECEYEMDNGALIRVAVRVDLSARSAVIDFTGTSAQAGDGFNAPVAVTTAAVLYVFRTLVDDDIPLNEGCLAPLRLIVPEGSLLNPRPPAAVVAGNVETSQCVVGALYRALGVMAEAQGTMNNVTFGDEQYQYYETVAGGSGAGPGFDGTACVQTHMTNSRLTDPEVLEARYPVRVESFAIRAGSGGAGRWRGGDGAVRRLRFGSAMTASILSGHRRLAPYGMAGGADGAVGATFVERADGTITDLGATGSTAVGAGDVLVVETPGGGGYGVPHE